ncbi:LysR family transcriptional regulator, partial [Hafnia paralvei]|nr:LysR family transcriptional regulator [Hafnia paralvei]
VQRSYYGIERIVDAATHIRQFQQAQLSIACLPAFSQSLLPNVCRTFLGEYQDVSLNVIPQESPLLEEWLSAQRYDLGLTENTYTPPGTERRTLATLNEICVLPSNHPLLSKKRLTPQDFEEQRYISLSPNDGYRQTLDALFHREQVSRQMVVETHSAASICAMVCQGVGVSIVNPLTALDFVGCGVEIRPFSVDVPFTVSLIVPKHRPSSALVEAFIAHLEGYISEVYLRLKGSFPQF